MAIVPARLGSTRMPRKMLRRDTGQYLFEHTVRNAELAASLEEVVLATDSEEIESAAKDVGIRAVMTSPDIRSGSDRVFAALRDLTGDAPHWDVVVNVQGDEPELPAEALDRLVEAFGDPAVELATLSSPIRTCAELDDPNVVKVVAASDGRALYFSRAAIPARAHPDSDVADLSAIASRHIGVYAFRPAALARFCQLPPGRLEVTESLEQLRWLEAGGAIHVVAIDEAPRDINTEEQYLEFASRQRRSQQGLRT